MKKLLIPISLVLILLFSTFAAVSAKTKLVNIKGEVTAINGSLVTVVTVKDAVYNVHVPDDFNIGALLIGDEILAKAESLEDGTWQALTFKILGKPDTEEEDMDDEGEEEEDDDDDEEIKGERLNAAFCDPDKKDTPHPLAVKIAEQYEVEEEWVMQHYCSGHSLGAIKLALITSMMEGVEVDADTLLEMHAGGTGWGEIWQELEVSGNQDKGRIPPGQLAKKNANKFKEKDN